MFGYNFQEFFFFSGSVENLLYEGWTIASTKDLVLALLAVSGAALFIEILRRISRECWRRVPVPSGSSGHGVGSNSVIRRQSDRIPLTRYTSLQEAKTTAEDSLCVEPEEVTSCVNENQKADCCDGGQSIIKPCSVSNTNHTADTDQGEKIAFLDTEMLHSQCDVIKQPPCCVQDGAPSSEDHRESRLDTMWRSLSLEFLPDRWEIIQGTSEAREPSQKKISQSTRVLFHLLQTVVSMVQLTIGYMLMLIVMTYNAWFLIVVVGGAGLGHLILSRDLERLYANYARSAVKKRLLREASKRKTCVKTPPCRTLWKNTSRQESLD
ncbi:uncharacterized protein LOC117290613 isoform X1 [Asterias rubens]|uniref:uncharacterized protein LOC117290613 isoform X1 n=1 Tax=Asterias rubens TaxID=7604 RepID=UPI001455AD5E|nr:uncharacterized protein LOC117290613 isoform X1 [Asterias rubens]